MKLSEHHQQVLSSSVALDHRSRGFYVDVTGEPSIDDLLAGAAKKRSFRVNKQQQQPATSGTKAHASSGGSGEAEARPVAFSFWALVEGMPGKGSMALLHKAKPNYDLHNRTGNGRVVRADLLVRTGRVYFEVVTRSGNAVQVGAVG